MDDRFDLRSRNCSRLVRPLSNEMCLEVRSDQNDVKNDQSLHGVSCFFDLLWIWELASIFQARTWFILKVFRRFSLICMHLIYLSGFIEQAFYNCLHITLPTLKVKSKDFRLAFFPIYPSWYHGHNVCISSKLKSVSPAVEMLDRPSVAKEINK